LIHHRKKATSDAVDHARHNGDSDAAANTVKQTKTSRKRNATPITYISSSRKRRCTLRDRPIRLVVYKQDTVLDIKLQVDMIDCIEDLANTKCRLLRNMLSVLFVKSCILIMKN
jgi:hypothetical protein